MNKILLTISVSCFSLAYSQNLTFTDSKFKALALSSSPSNSIAKDFNGNYIAIDANNDGEIQLSEAQQVKVLTLQQDPNQKYIDPNGNPSDPNNINISYYNNHLPTGISDALLFPNIEELYFWDVKTANINFVNNSKIKKVQGRPIYFEISQANQTTAAPINISFDNCPGIHNINDVIAYQSTMNPWIAPENSLTIKNCGITGDVIIDQAELMQMYIENSNINTLTFNSCKFLEKISVPNLTSLTKISVLGTSSSTGTGIELVANNCTNLQEISADTDHDNSTGTYFSSINVNGNTNLKKIKGLNAPSINLSTAGLINLEELDCSFYNELIYFTNSGVYLGNVSSLNLSGLPKLKTLKAFNQPITNNVNFNTATALENIDITNSCGYMTTLNINNLSNLTTLKSNVLASYAYPTLHFDLQQINAKNCVALTDFQISGNHNLKSLDLQNCLSLQALNIGSAPVSSSHYFPELTTLNIKQCTALEELNIFNTKLTELDASDCSALATLSLGGNANLAYANIKNNAIENTNFSSNNTNLSMCVDEAQLTTLQALYPNITFTSNCGGFLTTNNSKINKDQIDIFPNPVKDFVTVRSDEKIKSIQLLDAQGRIINTQNENNEEIKINLSSYPTGNYVMKIKTESREIFKKIIKK
ncbi:T9SS type A sorting domain-containing protein [Chryseobacterium sp.]|uniref:T9SS type A sorting domain-containing protein n=1 Tax=Chryseobacterium sp. TaxID=1871047 RepID=UPI00289F4F0E|nr:T9SS type A sorting domain-containing protein [Chryseobacterium sp.]